MRRDFYKRNDGKEDDDYVQQENKTPKTNETTLVKTLKLLLMIGTVEMRRGPMPF